MKKYCTAEGIADVQRFLPKVIVSEIYHKGAQAKNIAYSKISTETKKKNPVYVTVQLIRSFEELPTTREYVRFSTAYAHIHTYCQCFIQTFEFAKKQLGKQWTMREVVQFVNLW